MINQNITLETIHKDLEFLKDKIIKIEEHMVDVDSIMTEDDYKALRDYEKEKSEGKLTSHKALKKVLNL